MSLDGIVRKVEFKHENKIQSVYFGNCSVGYIAHSMEKYIKRPYKIYFMVPYGLCEWECYLSFMTFNGVPTPNWREPHELL